jgi:hypothetical protein
VMDLLQLPLRVASRAEPKKTISGFSYFMIVPPS